MIYQISTCQNSTLSCDSNHHCTSFKYFRSNYKWCLHQIWIFQKFLNQPSHLHCPLFLTGFLTHLFSFNKEWFPLKTWSSMLIESVAVMLWRPQYHGCQVCSWRLNAHSLFQVLSTLQNAVLFMQWDLLVTLIHQSITKNKLFKNSLQTRGIWKYQLCILVWMENILKAELFKTNVMTVIMWFCPKAE